MTTVCIEQNHAHGGGASTTSGAFKTLFARAQNYFRLKKQQRINRQAFAQMMRLDDAMLKDIGVTRDDIRWANTLPLSENAALELKKISLRNRSKI